MKELADRLSRFPLFQGLDREGLEHLCELARVGELQPGEVVFIQNQIGDETALYVLLNGRVRVTRRTRQGVERELATIGAGGWFGESGLFRDQSRSATVTAIEPTTYAAFRRWGLEDELLRHPRLALRMLRAVLDKLSASNRLL
jgi:CRP/FNR family transcriptional regulator